MSLLLKALKSLSKREKMLVFLMLLVFGFSSLQLIQTSTDITETTGKVYTEAILGEIVHLNPLFTEFSEADADISSLIFSGLAKYNAATGKFEEDLATHTLSEDKLTYTFTLKNNVTWHDGTPVSASDILFTFNEVIQSNEFNNPLLKSNFDGVKIEELNSRTVTFTLNSPNAFFFSGLTVGLVPKHILGEVAISELDTDPFNRLPIGTGPYRVTEAYSINPDGSTSVVLSRYEDFYGTKSQIELLRFVTYTSFEDLIANRSTWHGTARINNASLDSMDLTDLVTYEYDLPQYTALFLNTDSENLNKNKERLAISKAINKQEILSAIGYKIQIDTPLLELNQEEWIHTSDAEEASGALFDAGWTLEEEADFRTNAAGETYTLRLIRRDFSQENSSQELISALTAEVIRSQLEDVGVEIIIEAYSNLELQSKLIARDYDLLLYGQSLGYNLDTFSYWHSSQSTETGLNLSNYQNSKADLEIEAIRESFDPAEHEEQLTNLAEIIATDVPAIFLYTPSYYYLVDTELTGLNFEKLLRPKDRFSNIEAWIFN
jgi:peptide/nickel transport system substrate-binding protein